MPGWTNDERRSVEKGARKEHPIGVTIAAGLTVALVAIPVIILWGALMVRLWRWAF